MELRHLRYFVSVAEELHFGRAARRLSISQPPLSLTVRQLEEDLGVRLLERTNKRVTLTEAGKVFLSEARHVLAQARQARELARKVGAGSVGYLRVGFVGSMLYRGLPEILSDFNAQNPRVEIVLREMNSAELVEAIRRSGLDVGFIHAAILPTGLNGLAFLAERFVCCLAESHPLAKVRRLDLARLANEPFVLFSRDVSPRYYDLVITICEQAGIVPSKRHEVRHWLTVVALVAQRMGVALVPEALVRSRMAGVRFLPIRNQSIQSVTHCIWPRNREIPGLSAFIECVRQRVDKPVNSPTRKRAASGGRK